MNNATYALLTILVAAAVTAALRFIPFLLFGGDRKTPKLIVYLGKVLPCTIMGMLVVYCLKDVTLDAAPFGIPELLGCLITGALHVWKRNSLLSIGAGTASYMLMIHFFF
ncbi:MAG: AzlD domain-containing protein [Oscillospiraceae bacterium]|nr:AzlD domain-containing protein [Oscillospiraceae bacterium]